MVFNRTERFLRSDFQIFSCSRPRVSLPLPLAWHMSRHVVSTNEIPEGETHRGLVAIQERCRYRVCGLKLCRFSLLCGSGGGWWSSSRSRSATNDPISNSGIQQADQQKCARGPLPSLALTRATLEYKSMSLQSMTTLLFRRRVEGGRERGWQNGNWNSLSPFFFFFFFFFDNATDTRRVRGGRSLSREPEINNFAFN